MLMYTSYLGDFFKLRFKHLGFYSKGKKQRSVTYSTERDDGVNKTFIISLLGV